jgi:hypothetical protein
MLLEMTKGYCNFFKGKETGIHNKKNSVAVGGWQ